MARFHRRGFTLLEVLVITAVVSVLAAILYPVLSRARERGFLTRCTNNLHALSVAAMAYTADYDETYPLARATIIQDGAPRVWTWKRAILPYVRDREVFRCPRVRNPWPRCMDAPYALGDAGNAAAELQYEGARSLWLPASYAYSGGFFAARRADGTMLARRTADAADPSTLLYIVPSRIGATSVGPEAMEGGGVSPYTGLADARFDGRFGPFPAHLGRLPFVMADGRVAALTLEDTAAPVDRWQSTNPLWNSRTTGGRRRLVNAAHQMQATFTEYQ